MTQEYKKQFLKKLIFIGALPLFGVCMSACAEEAAPVAEATQSEAVQASVPATDADSAARAQLSEKDDRILSRFSYLGVALDSLPASTYCENSVPGVQAIFVRDGSPADLAGIRAGDILISLDGQKLFFPNQFSALVRSYKPGTDVEIVLLRGGEKMTKKATIGERCIAAPNRGNRADAHSKDDVRLYINGKEISLSDGTDLGGWISLTPNGVLIRDRLDIPSEFRRLVNRAHAKLPDTQKVLSFLRRQYDDARKAALGKARQTFSQVFFGQGNSVIIVGDEKGRQVTVSRAGDDDILFRGPCTTQSDIDKIPEDAKEIIDSFTELKPMFEKELPEVTDAAVTPPSE